MPCYSPTDADMANAKGYQEGLKVNASRHPEDGETIEKMHRHAEYLTDVAKGFEGMLCAIITELEHRGIANDVISTASRDGLIGIMKFWEEHSKLDEARIAKELHKFSEQEQEVFKKLLNAKA